MKFTDISSAPASEYAYLKQMMDASTFWDPYVFDNVQLPAGCKPSKVNVFFTKTEDGYGIHLAGQITYTGTNRAMQMLCDGSHITCETWEQFVAFCRALPGNNHPTPPNVTNTRNITDYSQVRYRQQKMYYPSHKTLKMELENRVVGQDFAIDTIAQQVSLFLQKKAPNKPVSFLLYGPPGTGKTETAKALGDALKRASPSYKVVQVDLNSYTDAHSSYRLTGAPPGYVGYDDPAVFEAVDENPYTVFIFDELDKAHPEVLKVFMSILDEGQCSARKETTDHAFVYDFRHCILFFTSNYNLGSTSDGDWQFGFSGRNNVESISMEGKAVNVQYRKQPKSQELPLAQRIYMQNEQARRAFVRAGALKEIASRFGCFVEFRTLDDGTKIRILAKQIVNTGLEYGVRLSYIDPEIMQGIVDAATAEQSLTVRSFKPVIEGYLAALFAATAAESGPDAGEYALAGTLSQPRLLPAKNAGKGQNQGSG